MDILEEIEGLNDGKVYQDGNEALKLVVDRVLATGGKGSVTIKIDVERVISEGIVAAVLAGTAAVATLPKRKAVGRVRFRDRHGNLTNHKPGGQQELPNLQTIAGGASVVRDVDGDTPITREA